MIFTAALQYVVKSLDEFRNNCIPMRCGARLVIERLRCSRFLSFDTRSAVP